MLVPKDINILLIVNVFFWFLFLVKVDESKILLVLCYHFFNK